ncbi:MAG: hypothetical protein V4501_02720, partial [Pseudomonadota bacterium]
MPNHSTKLDTLQEIVCTLTEQGELKKLTQVITKFIVINFSTADHNPFHFAINHPDIIAYLTSPEAPVYQKFYDKTVEIHAAAFAGRSDEVLSILKSKPEQITLTTTRGENVFYWAAVGRQFNLIDTLLKNYSEKDDCIYDIIAGASYLAEYYYSRKQYTEAKTVYELIIAYQAQLKNFNYEDNADIDDCRSKIKKCIKQIEFAFTQPEIKNTKTESIFTRLDELNDTQCFAKEDSVKTVAKQWGFKPYNVAYDGNCQFSAISHQIALNRPLLPERHRRHTPYSLRQLAVQHLETNRDLYRGFFGETTAPNSNLSIDENINKYLNEMAISSWGDHLTIVALVAELKICLVIISSDKSNPIIVKAQDPVANLYIIHENRNHYQSTMIHDAEKIPNGIQVLIDIAPTEDITQFAILTYEKIYAPNPEDDKIYNDEDSESDEKANGHVELIQQPKMLETEKETFKLMSTIADPATPFAAAEALINNNNINSIDAAVLRGDWDTLEEILTVELIDRENDDFHTPFYWAALVGNDGVIQLLSWHHAFATLEPTRQAYCFDDAVKGARDRAEILFDLNDINEINDMESCIIAYENAIDYADKAIGFIFSEDDDDMLGDLNEKLYYALDCWLAILLENQKLTEAIVVKKKLIACYPASSNFNTNFLQILQAQLAGLEEEEKSQADVKPVVSTQKTPLVKTLFSKTPPLPEIKNEERKRKKFGSF